jgi:hypothetical protein
LLDVTGDNGGHVVTGTVRCDGDGLARSSGPDKGNAHVAPILPVSVRPW